MPALSGGEGSLPRLRPGSSWPASRTRYCVPRFRFFHREVCNSIPYAIPKIRNSKLRMQDARLPAPPSTSVTLSLSTGRLDSLFSQKTRTIPRRAQDDTGKTNGRRARRPIVPEPFDKSEPDSRLLSELMAPSKVEWLRVEGSRPTFPPTVADAVTGVPPGFVRPKAARDGRCYNPAICSHLADTCPCRRRLA